MATESTGLPLLPKFKGTGLSVKEALEASLVAAGVEPGVMEKALKQHKGAGKVKSKKTPAIGTYAEETSLVDAALPVSTGASGTKYQIHIPAALLARVMKPVTGQGGWQTTATLMQGRMDGETLYLDGALWDRILHQSVTGSGGWQSVCRHVVCLVVSKYGVGGNHV